MVSSHWLEPHCIQAEPLASRTLREERCYCVQCDLKPCDEQVALVWWLATGDCSSIELAEVCYKGPGENSVTFGCAATVYGVVMAAAAVLVSAMRS